MRHLIILTLVFSILGCNKSAVEQTETCSFNGADSSAKHPKNNKFKAILEKYKKLGLPGISLLIEDENGVWMGGVGKSDIANNIDFKPCTVSKVASITKMMFATAVMQLREQGKLKMDDKVAQYLDPKIVEKIKNADKFTIQDLMQHSTGVYEIISDGDFYLAVLNNPNKKWKGEELIKFVYNKPTALDYQANGTKGSYSSTNTLLLSLCIDKITGKNHHHAMHELVIDKLGLKNTYYYSHDALPKQTAEGYYDLYNNGTILNVSNLNTGSGNGFGGVYSNVVDLHKFIRALFIEKTLVNQQSLDVMNTFITDDDNSELGVGILKQALNNPNGHYKIGHSGRDLGYSGDAHYFPTKNNRILIYLVNYGSNGNTALRPAYYQFRDEMALELTNY